MTAPVTKEGYSEPDYAKSRKEKSEYPFYLPSIDKYLLPQTQLLLEQYSKVPISHQSEHVHEIVRPLQSTNSGKRITTNTAFTCTARAMWAIRKYPCIGLGFFLAPYISRSPAYPTILERLKKSATLIDVGCFVGSDLRQLAFSGAPTVNMYGIDIANHWDIGYSLFRDESGFEAHFIEAEILSSDNPKLLALGTNVDIIIASALLHQWAWDKQVEVAKKVAAFTKQGSIVVGYQVVNATVKQFVNQAFQVPRWWHSPTSFRTMWDQVGVETGTRWETEAWLRTFQHLELDVSDVAWLDPGDMIIDFVVTRVE